MSTRERRQLVTQLIYAAQRFDAQGIELPGVRPTRVVVVSEAKYDQIRDLATAIMLLDGAPVGEKPKRRRD